ncbi:MAG TPA: phosphopentomutase [Rhodothermales bacterium]
MLFLTIILDGVGIGAQPDSVKYGDEAAATLQHVCAATRPSLPNLTRAGLGNIVPLESVPPVPRPRASFGRMREVSAGKDSTTGHWEMSGIRLDRPFPTYPHGFPERLIDRFVALTGYQGVLGNRAASGTEIVEQLGDQHARTGLPIVYTSADSVFQIAAHLEVIPIPDLYHLCRVVREQVCVGEDAVGRVIARPFTGTPGAFVRVSDRRKDYALPPPGPVLQGALQEGGVHTIAVGKVAELFAGVGFDGSRKTRTNAEGIDVLLEYMHAFRTNPRPTFLWANLVEFDQEYGHRNDVEGFARALEEFDAALPTLLENLRSGSRLLITADHGNDPTHPGTDHTREYVPILYFGGEAGRDLGVRESFGDHAATVADFFQVTFSGAGSSFL